MILFKLAAFVCLWGVGLTANTLVGDTYSCYSEFESIATNGCKSRINGDGDSYEQETLIETDNNDFCTTGPVYGNSKQGSFGKAKSYIASASMKMSDMGLYSKAYGFFGLAFNMMDSKTYDIVYVRPHSEEFCWQIGHVENGLFFGRDSGNCDMKLSGTVFLAVKIENGKGKIYINNGEMAEFTPFYPSVNKVATALRNNMVATLSTSGLEVCQEVSCVSRNADGKMVVTKPGKHYQDSSMTKCEACTCMPYGQIQCGCRSAEAQGVTCSSNMIAATGHDCCARCVPPSATCYASGDPHYKSWDGKYFDFQGSCTYCLAKTSDFTVNQKNFGGGSVSYNEYCQLQFDGDQFEMRSTLNYTPKDGTETAVVTPFKKYYNSVDYVLCTSQAQCAVYLKGQKMLDISCPYKRAVNLWIHGTYYEKTECLCGTWDGDANNDFKDRDGKAVSSPNLMASSWRVSNDDGCPNPPEPTDPCDEVDRATRSWAEQFCARYKSEPFKSCPVDVTESFQNCMFDLCTDPSTDDNVCQNAEAYAAACSAAGHPVIGWRSSSFCPLDCDDSFVYNNCGKGCFPTCEDPNPVDCVETCVEGCYCPSGTVLQGGRCIDSSDCQCLFEGQFIENGQSWNDSAKCETCNCQDGGIIDCDPLACGSCPAGQVPVSKSGMCCPICLADWTEEKEERVEVTEETDPVKLECILHDDVLVAPDAITWRYSNGDEISADNKPDNFEFDKTNLILTIDPAHIGDDNDYTAEVIYNGVVGQCKFELVVIPVPPVNYIDIQGESPRTVKETECQTMSVQVNGDFEFGATDFTWTYGPLRSPIDFSNDKFTKSNGGKTLQVCDAGDTDEGKYECCVTKDDVTDCVEIELQVLAVCDTDEQEYLEGETWQEGEFTDCTCLASGEADCNCVEQALECVDSEELYYDDNCEAHCSRLPATCLVTGDPHYKSFDGYRHDFQGGNCKFTVVKTEDFEVIGTNTHRNNNMVASWNDAVDINFETLNIHLGATGLVTINGADASLPYKKTWRSKKSISITKAGESVIVSIGLGNDLEALDVVWDGNSTVSSTVHGKYYGATSGLCGVWDDEVNNDQTGSDGAVDEDLNSFGWSWKVVEGDEVCEEEPQPEHPCDETFFPDAKPIADESCDILIAAPFSACHELVDVESASYNCKYDTCSCWDASCACHAVKEYVKECQEAGVQGLGAWRTFADFCPMDCEDGLSYDPCGSFCPATCGDKSPDCGKLEGKCNEGCFCPHDTYLQNGTCVFAAECMCEFNGNFMDIGATWEDTNTCQDCACRAEGEVVCEAIKKDKCNKQSQEVWGDDECRPECVEDWLWAAQGDYLDVPQHADLEVTCMSIVKPFKLAWEYSKDGTTWEVITGNSKVKPDGDNFKLIYTIEDITNADDGMYRCTAKKSYKTKDVVVIVKTAAAATTCTALNPENGLAEPASPEIGATVEYKCEDDYVLIGESSATCELDGSVSGDVPVCQAIEALLFDIPKKTKAKKDKVTLKCSIEDDSFAKKQMAEFFFVNDDGSRELVTGTVKYKRAKGVTTYSVQTSTVDKPSSAVCIATNADGTKQAVGEIKIL